MKILPTAAYGSDSDGSVNGGGAATRRGGDGCMWWRGLPPRLGEDAMAAARPSNAGVPPSPLLLSALPFPPISLSFSFIFFSFFFLLRYVGSVVCGCCWRKEGVAVGKEVARLG
ncbi:uncharacterized protein DS421_14g470400 [Arachis hypogaea]|nr:uncharacterized protein DS421_14g470400 [Arachis hypogaea]